MMHNTGIESGSVETAPGALSVAGPQPAWMTLGEARERAFTGEVVFEVDPEVRAYLDNGVVYYAERASDAPLGRRLIDAGVVDTAQLERGTVRVGDVEHLGRLFDREPSVDRDAVLVVTETATEDLIAELANAAVTTVRVTAYRHHPSGVHRWFVAQIESPLPPRPVGSAGHLDSTVIEELPGLSTVADDELTIEWDEIDEVLLAAEPEIMEEDFEPLDDRHDDEFVESVEPVEPVELLVEDEPVTVDEAETIDIDFGAHEAGDVVDTDESAFDRFDLEVETDGEVDGAVDVADESSDGADFEYQVMWPDGTEEPVEAREAAESEAAEDARAAASEYAEITEDEDGTLHFEMPELEVGDDSMDDAAADEVPDDVAAAVRRAIAAIESASAQPTIRPADELVDDELVDDELVEDEPAIVDTFDTDITTEVEAVAPALDGPARTLEAPAPVGLGAFAPPTMDMRAEVIYARAEQAAADEAEFTPNAESSLPAPEVAPMVAVDHEPGPETDNDSGNERTSALRRLIGSLRRKDH